MTSHAQGRFNAPVFHGNNIKYSDPPAVSDVQSSDLINCLELVVANGIVGMNKDGDKDGNKDGDNLW